MSWSFNTCLSYIKRGLCSITIVLYFQTRQPALFMQFNSLNYLDLMRYLEYISQCKTFESKFCNKTYYWKKPLIVDAQLPKSKIVGLIMKQEFELIWHLVFEKVNLTLSHIKVAILSIFSNGDHIFVKWLLVLFNPNPKKF